MSGTTKESHFSAALMLFFTKLSTAKAAWYSIKALSSDIPSLPTILLGLNYETMIIQDLQGPLARCSWLTNVILLFLSTIWARFWSAHIIVSKVRRVTTYVLEIAS
jgi:hypothetical protein